MANINIENLKVGMVLNSDARDLNGRLLLPAETVITDKHIFIFKTWGVISVDIKSEKEETINSQISKDIPKEVVSNIKKTFDHLFSLNNIGNDFVKHMYDICIIHHISNQKLCQKK